MTPQPDRNERIEQIRDSALVGMKVGVASLHRRLPDGRHVVIFYGKVFEADTLEEAIRLAKEARG